MKRFMLVMLLCLMSTPVLAQDADAGSSSVVIDAGVVEVPALPVVSAPLSPDAGSDIQFVVEAAKSIHKAVTQKEWGRLIFLIITVLVVICRKFLAPRIAFFRGKLGAPLLAFLWAGAGALATAWPAGEKLTMSDLFLTLQAGIMAAGGWSLLKAFLEHFYPKDGTENWATVIAKVIGSLAKPEPTPAEAPKPS